MTEYKYSRYRNAAVATDAKGQLWLPKRPRIARKDYPDNITHTAIEGEDCTLLAYKYLEDERMAWVVAEFNGIFNPLEYFKGGERLIIPSQRTLYTEILPAVTGR